MKLLGAIRWNAKQVQAARAGGLTQIRAHASAYDPDKHARKPSLLGRARPGDLLWIGEPRTCWIGRRSDHFASVYDADCPGGFGAQPERLKNIYCRRRMFRADQMKRADSRLTLLVTGHALARLHSIGSEAAEATGIRMVMRAGRPNYETIDQPILYGPTPQQAFLEQWKRRYGKHSFENNPELAVITFRLIEQNADELLRAERDGQGAARVAQEALGAG